MPKIKFTADDRNRALGALTASAVLKDGVWHPEFRGVGRDLGVSPRTLKRWWDERDTRDDEAVRRAATRGVTVAAKRGAEQWLARVYHRCKLAVDVVMDDLEKPRLEGVDDKGRGWETGPNVAQRMGAIKTVVEVADVIDAKIEGKGEDVAKAGAALARLKDTVHRTGLGKR